MGVIKTGLVEAKLEPTTHELRLNCPVLRRFYDLHIMVSHPKPALVGRVASSGSWQSHLALNFLAGRECLKSSQRASAQSKLAARSSQSCLTQIYGLSCYLRRITQHLQH
ncbi:hypothetical protein EYF80_002409 [Liparis tanakae]|uniref:Uncharacterized protein n=1 Tax=Liparis tanakae TaxID=230148 RepID=A0A4Z2JB19_9TELE|nr:hypothetical protein EYF80_002409 [Liparis tanakae]